MIFTAIASSAASRSAPDMIRHRSTRSRLLSSQGFTLAEVLFAMAIFVFGVLVMVGTLPNGLGSMQAARLRSAEVRIFQHLQAVYQAELDRTNANNSDSTITSLRLPATFYFDDRGDPLRSNENSTVQASIAAQARIEDAALLPGETLPSPFIRRLRVRVSDRWQQGNAFTDPARYRQRMLPLTLTTPRPRVAAPTSDDTPSTP